MCQDNNLQTPLHAAIKAGKLETFKYLIRKGVWVWCFSVILLGVITSAWCVTEWTNHRLPLCLQATEDRPRWKWLMACMSSTIGQWFWQVMGLTLVIVIYEMGTGFFHCYLFSACHIYVRFSTPPLAIYTHTYACIHMHACLIVHTHTQKKSVLSNALFTQLTVLHCCTGDIS